MAAEKPIVDGQVMMTYEEIDEIAKHLLGKTSYRPKIGIICGSGLGGLADKLSKPDVFDYTSIPNFPTSTVAGHAGKLVFGQLSGQECVCMKGRFHPYEGYPLWKVVIPIRVMQLIGVKILVVTNAAGGLNPDFNVGDIMMINDHIDIGSLAGNNPLRGPNDERFGVRFVPMNGAYDPHLRRLASEASEKLSMTSFTRHGVYVKVGGPSYETPAELRLLRQVGADAVGMSTTTEVIAARHGGIRVVGLSLITNIVVMDANQTDGGPTHEEVLETGRRRATDMERLVTELVGSCGEILK